MHYVNLDTQGIVSPADAPLLTLLKRENRYDILLGGNSLRSDGAVSSNPVAGGKSVHILNAAAGMDHFLFDLELDGSGELRWPSAVTTCNPVLD